MENNRIIYLIAAVATGWAVTYTLRALPFILFSRKARELPPWAGRLGNLISPLIIFPALTAIHQDPGIVCAETIGQVLGEQGIVHTGKRKGGIFFCTVQDAFLSDQYIRTGQFQQLGNCTTTHLPAVGTGENGGGLP